jgi:hypothetical protein
MRVLLSLGIAAGLALTSMALTLPSRATADDVPVLDIKPVCRGIADQSAEPGETGGPDLAFEQCVQSEQQVRKDLIKEWPTFSTDDRGHCVKEATMGGEASYTDLITCLEMARDVKELNSPKKTSNKSKSTN